MKFLSRVEKQLFNSQVWEIVRKIPPGRVATYGQIARLIQALPGMEPKEYQAWSPRWVGAAMAACPEDVPWQRVINSQGKISLREGADQSVQRQLLEEEGVLFDSHERVDLKKYGWNDQDLTMK
jgi:methylated-DNA-protein-cysteine methyltransferase-like protein